MAGSADSGMQYPSDSGASGMLIANGVVDLLFARLYRNVRRVATRQWRYETCPDCWFDILLGLFGE